MLSFKRVLEQLFPLLSIMAMQPSILNLNFFLLNFFIVNFIFNFQFDIS